jgi:phage repressor protein C with HTH and peptisase S24 domain
MMEHHPDSAHERLAWARERAGFLTKESFASVVQVNPTTYRAYENGQNGYAKLAARFAAKLGVSAEWLLEGGARPTGLAPDLPVSRSIGGGETGAVAKLDLRLPMGPGATVDDYVEEEPVEFDLAYIRSFSRSPLSRLRIAEGVGDSMFPTLVSADLVWIDTTQNQLLHSDRIYAASINGGAAIKRLRPIDGGKRVLIISDNKTVDSYEVDAQDVVIWGRVIRFSRNL